jgi:transposase-like protein
MVPSNPQAPRDGRWQVERIDTEPSTAADHTRAVAILHKTTMATLGDDVRVGIYVRRFTDDEHQPYFLDNAIESLNRRYRRAVRARGHFPTDQAALKCLYLVTRSLDPTGRGKTRWAIRWKPALNAFAITFQGRILPSIAN